MSNLRADRSPPPPGESEPVSASSPQWWDVRNSALWKRSAVRIAVLVLLALSPGLFLLATIDRLGVDVPFADEFSFTPFLERAQTGSLKFGDLYAQHNEHRYLLPRLLLIVFANLADGDLRAQMFFSVFLAALIGTAIWALIRRTVTTSIEKSLLLTFLVSLLLFSPVQAENWTWGFQFTLFLSCLLFVAGLLLATSRMRLECRFIGCALLAALASFSFGNGVLLWGLTFPVGLLLSWFRDGRKHIGWWVAWAGMAIATMLLYFVDFRWPAHVPTVSSPGPIDYGLYVAGFLGAHLSEADWQQPFLPTAFIGVALLALYVAATVYVFRRRNNVRLIERSMPWIILGSFAVANAVLAAIARTRLGVTQSLDSRYTTFSLYLSVALIGLAAIIIPELRRAFPAARERWVRVETALLVCFFALVFDSFSWGEDSMAARHRSRLMGKGALLFSNVIDSGPLHDRYLMAHAPEARAYANTLDRLGLLHPRMLKTANIASLRTVTHDHNATGFLDILEVNGSVCTVEGWAVIPYAGRPADSVVLAYTEPGRGPVAFRITDGVKERTDVAASLKDQGVQSSGFTGRFDRSEVPPGRQILTAWAFDADKGRLFPLGTPRTLE